MHMVPAATFLQALFWGLWAVLTLALVIRGRFTLNRFFLRFWFCMAFVIVAAHFYSHLDIYTNLFQGKWWSQYHQPTP